MSDKPFHHWRLCSFLGVVLTVVGLLLMGVFPQTGYDIPAGYGGPVFAFEMARTQSDLLAVFGPVGDPMRAERIAQMDAGNWWDFPFMALYALFMASFMWALFKQSGYKRWAIMTVIALLSGFFDAIENVILLGLTADIEATKNVEFLT